MNSARQTAKHVDASELSKTTLTHKVEESYGSIS
jgi:hypothetical protein